jgi:hypothetical protein
VEFQVHSWNLGSLEREIYILYGGFTVNPHQNHPNKSINPPEIPDFLG